MKKTLDIIRTVFVWLVVAVAVFMMIFTVISVNFFNRNDRDLFGYKAFIVNSDSMAKTHFKSGDLIFVKEVAFDTLAEGDIITYISQNTENFGKIVTHMIRSKTTDANGHAGFITYGTSTGDDDETVVTQPYILGKYVSRIPGLGTFFNFLKSPVGYIVCIFVPFMLLILYNGVNSIRLFRRYKQEQTAAMEQEKAQLAAEREENARMMEQLLALKAQLENQKEAPSQGGPDDAQS